MKNRRRGWPWCWPALVLLLASITASADSAPTTVFLVRHAEKQAGSDPSLTDAGRERAAELGRVLSVEEIDVVLSSQFRRTRETVEPLAQKIGVEVTVVPIKDAVASSKALAQRILSDMGGKTVLVVGHSNTVPMIVEALGAGSPAAIDESQYDDLFVVTLTPSGAVSTHLKYGARTAADP